MVFYQYWLYFTFIADNSFYNFIYSNLGLALEGSEWEDRLDSKTFS